SVLRLDGSVAAGDTVTFAGTSAGVLDLTGSTISGNQLNGFAAAITGLGTSTSGAGLTASNYIDLASVNVSSISSVTQSGSVTTVNSTNPGTSFALNLSAASGAFVDWTADTSGNGTAIFLTASPNYHARGTNDSWSDTKAWGGAVPSTTPAAGANSFTFF